MERMAHSEKSGLFLKKDVLWGTRSSPVHNRGESSPAVLTESMDIDRPLSWTGARGEEGDFLRVVQAPAPQETTDQF